MYLSRKRASTPSFQMFREDGTATQLNLTFKNGEMHINPVQMAKGKYQLTIDRGTIIESRVITID